MFSYASILLRNLDVPGIRLVSDFLLGMAVGMVMAYGVLNCKHLLLKKISQ
jgi:hypothetical protein